MSSFYSLIIKTLKLNLAISLLLINSTQLNSASHPNQLQVNKIIANLYWAIKKQPNQSMPARLEFISAQFLGAPYLLGALGEGKMARFDQYPLYRVDAFDCETYVTTILALAMANNVSDFKTYLRKLTYKNAKVSFITRNHFADIDWNVNNQAQKFIVDITTSFKNKDSTTPTKIATAFINKPAWYQHLTESDIRLTKHNEQKERYLLKQLKLLGANLPKTYSHLAYLPLSALFDKNGRPNMFLFAQIPNAAIIEIVRPNWETRKTTGTNQNVSHIGLVFWIKGLPYFREASQIYGKVTDVSLINYLANARKSPTIRGINIQVLKERT